jgi:hypothetical protein
MAAYTQCLRCAGAPRRPAGGSGLSLPFLLGMPLSMTPGSSIIASPELRCRHRLRRVLSGSALPILPQSVSRGARISGLPDSRICYGLPSCSPPLYGSDRCTRPPRAFTSRLPTDRSPSPLPDISTTATGLLCWRDSHPLEWQLASLHQNRTGPIRAYGLYGAFFVKGASRHFCRALLLHSFVRPAPRAFFHPDRTLPSPSRAVAVKDGASSAPPKACP